MESESFNKSVLELLEEGEREMLTESSGGGLFQNKLQKVMSRIKHAYQSEKSVSVRKESAQSISASVKTMIRNRKTTNQEEVENDSTEDEEDKHSLENEIEVTRRLLEVSLIREEQSKQRIASLEADVAKLGVMVEEGEALRRNEGLSLQELVALKKQLAADNETLTADNQLLSQQSALLRIEMHEMLDDKKRLDARLDQLQQELTKHRDHLEKEVELNAVTSQKLEEVTAQLRDKENDVAQFSQQLENEQKQSKELEVDNKTLEEQAKELEQSCTDLAERYEHVVHEFDTLRNDYVGLDGENSQLADQIKFLDSQIAKRQKEIGELELHQRSTVHHIELYDAEYRRADAEREVLEVQLRHLEVELERVRQLVASERVKTDKIVRDNRQLQSQLTELIGIREKQGDVWSTQQQLIKRLEQKLAEEAQSKVQLKAQVKQTHNEIDRCAVEIDNLRKELLVVISHWKTKENDCVRLTETIEVMEKQFQRHHGVAEALQIARSTADVELGKIKEENVHLERRMKTMVFMIENLKSELSSKEVLLVQEKHAKKKLEKQLSFMKKTVEEEKKRREEFGSKCSLAPVDRQMTQVQLSLQQVNQKLKEAQLQIQTEKNTNQTLEQRLITQKAQWDETCVQLRDQERQNLDQSQAIKQLQAQLSVLGIEFKRIEREKKSLLQKLRASTSVQGDFELLRETLLHEQSRTSALEVEKRTPVRIHPWRTLQYTDPAAYVAMMREQASKRRHISGDRAAKNRHKLPDVLPRRPTSYVPSLRRNEDDFQVALLKAVL